MMDVEEQITVNVTLTTLHRVLATVFIDGKETWRKLFTVGSVRELIAKTELSERVSLERILRFDTDFQELIDTDVNAGVRELDKFQIYYISSNTQDLLEGSVQPLQVIHSCILLFILLVVKVNISINKMFLSFLSVIQQL